MLRKKPGHARHQPIVEKKEVELQPGDKKRHFRVEAQRIILVMNSSIRSGFSRDRASCVAGLPELLFRVVFAFSVV